MHWVLQWIICYLPATVCNCSSGASVPLGSVLKLSEMVSLLKISGAHIVQGTNSGVYRSLLSCLCFRCRRKLRKNMFYPEYVDMEMEYLGEIMELEMNKFLHEELPCHMSRAFSSMCKKFSSNAASRRDAGCGRQPSLFSHLSHQ